MSRRSDAIRQIALFRPASLHLTLHVVSAGRCRCVGLAANDDVFFCLPADAAKQASHRMAGRNGWTLAIKQRERPSLAMSEPILEITSQPVPKPGEPNRNLLIVSIHAGPAKYSASVARGHLASQRYRFPCANRAFDIFSIHSHKAAHLLHSGSSCMPLETHLERPPIWLAKAIEFATNER